MDYYSTRMPDNYSLIRGFFIIILVTALIGLILFFTLEINLTTKGKEGLIVSKNAPIEYISPYDAEIAKVYVEEGQLVNKGDTLVLLNNTKMISELEKTKNAIDEIDMNLEIFKKQLLNLERKKRRQKKDIGIQNRKYKNEQKGSSLESSSLKEQLDLLEDKMSISEKRINKSRELLNKGAISEKEFDERYQGHLDEFNRFTKLKNDINQQSTSSMTLGDKHDEKVSKQKLNILNTESEILEREKTIENEKVKKEQLLTKLLKTQDDINKLAVVADIDGNVTNIFNTKRNVSLITRKQVLMVVSPTKEESFYVNMKIPEEEMKDIKVGQSVHIKIKAYNYYQFGILKGEVAFIDKEIAPRKESGNATEKAGEQFYILADIPETEGEKIKLQNGLKADAEIILEKVKLYKYVMNSMFKKV